MKILLVFIREDPSIVTLRNAILKCGFTVTCCKNIEETHEAFKKINYDLVFIDCRRSQSNSKLFTNLNQQVCTGQYEPENICLFIRKLFQYTVIVALTNNFEDREVPSIIPLLKIGFNKTFPETTNLNRCLNELLTLEYGEVSNVRRLQAAHVLFTALEYTNDSIEIMNDQFKIVYANATFEKLTGYTLNEISGQSFHKIHVTDLTQNDIASNLENGTIIEHHMPFLKSNGELLKYKCVTIPVIVQGEINKIKNYINIAHISTNNVFKMKKNDMTLNGVILTNGSMDSNENLEKTILNTKTQTMSSKRSYDFGKFAQLYGLDNQSKDSLRKTLSNNSYNSNVKLATMHPSISNTSSAAYSDDEKLGINSFQILNRMARSFPEFIQEDLMETSNTHVQRKRSYDVKSTSINYYETAQRRHSMARVHNHQVVETPIRKVINIITLAHNKSTTDIVKENLDKALNILRSTELYNPSNLENDKQTNDLVNGLMTNVMQSKNVNHIPEKSPLFTCAPISTNYIKNIPPEIKKILKKADSWSFDLMALERISNRRPLLTLGLNIMKRFEVCDFLKIDDITLINWLTLIESNYKPSNPYHNSTHASDVLHATAYFLSSERISEILDDRDKVAALIAAAAHDLNHPGRTNAFLCNSNNDLAILYNDQAVLENHHAALAFQLTRQNESANIFKNLNSDEYRVLRSIIIDMILATEMNKHFEHLNKFVNKFCQDDSQSVTKNIEYYKTTENKMLIKRILIKCADVSNPSRPLDIYKEWAFRIAAEYFEQTDEEKQKGLPVVMPTFDRHSCNIPKAQISFIEYFVTEMFEAWDDFIDMPEVISNLQANLLYWKECADSQTSLSVNQANHCDLKRNQSILEDIENEILDENLE